MGRCVFLDPILLERRVSRKSKIMILTYDKLNKVKGYFTEFLLTTFYEGKQCSVDKVYFRNDRDFNHYITDIKRQCTGPCASWSYNGEVSESRHNFSALEIWEAHDFKQLLFYNEEIDYIK